MPTPVVIDIYQGNDIQSMSALKAAGIIGIIHKATQGVSVHDHRYAARRAWAKQVGPGLWGAYHFNSETSSIKQQAIEFVKSAEPDEFTLLACDWEGDGPSTYFSPNDAREFLMRVMDLTKRDPSGLWIYGGNIPREHIITDRDMEFFGQFHNWHCQYGHTPVVSKAWKKGWELWQYSETGQLPGTGSKVDLNCYNGPIDQLRRDWAPGYNKIKLGPTGPMVGPTGATGVTWATGVPATPVQPPAKPIVIEPINKTPTKPVDHRPPAPTEPPSLGQRVWEWWMRH